MRTTVTTATLPAQTNSKTELTAYTLTAADRCDGCGAQAYIEVKVPARNKAGESIISELLFCIHHFNKHDAKIRPLALAVKDERTRLFSDEKARTQE